MAVGARGLFAPFAPFEASLDSTMVAPAPSMVVRAMGTADAVDQVRTEMVARRDAGVKLDICDVVEPPA